MGEVSSAVEAITSQLTVLHEVADGLSHRELVELLAELTTVLRSVPALEHRVLSRLRDEVEPGALGAASWPDVLCTALRVSKKDANRRLRQARVLGPRRAMTGEALPPVWEATATAQSGGLIGAEHVDVIERFHKQLPGWVDVDTRTQADAQLAELACGLGPEHLGQCADRLLMMIDQDGPAPADEDQEPKRCLMLGRQQRDGMSRVTGWLTAEARATWEAVLAALAAPGRCNPEDDTACVDGVNPHPSTPGQISALSRSATMTRLPPWAGRCWLQGNSARSAGYRPASSSRPLCKNCNPGPGWPSPAAAPCCRCAI